MPGCVPHADRVVWAGFLEETGLQLDGEAWGRFGKEGMWEGGVDCWGRGSSRGKAGDWISFWPLVKIPL